MHVSLTLYTERQKGILKKSMKCEGKILCKREFNVFILGMIQRLEKLKKNAFASCCLFGADNASAISGEYFFTWKIAWNLTYSGNEGRRLDMKMSNYTGPHMFMKLWILFFSVALKLYGIQYNLSIGLYKCAAFKLVNQ